MPYSGDGDYLIFSLPDLCNLCCSSYCIIPLLYLFSGLSYAANIVGESCSNHYCNFQSVQEVNE